MFSRQKELFSQESLHDRNLSSWVGIVDFDNGWQLGFCFIPWINLLPLSFHGIPFGVFISFTCLHGSSIFSSVSLVLPWIIYFTHPFHRILIASILLCADY